MHSVDLDGSSITTLTFEDKRKRLNFEKSGSITQFHVIP